MTDTYDFDLENFNIEPKHDNCIVKMQAKISEYKTPGGIRLPERWIDDRSPRKPVFGVIIDYGDIKINRFEEDDEIEKAKYTKYSFEQEVEPLKHVGMFNRARHLPFKHEGEDFSFVKMQNVMFIEPYKKDLFVDKNDREITEKTGWEYEEVSDAGAEFGDDPDKRYVNI